MWKKKIFNYKRFGWKYIAAKILQKLHIVDEEKVDAIKMSYYQSLEKQDYITELKEWYDCFVGGDDFEKPQTFNGKINWLKIHDVTPLKTKLADKYLVRDWVIQKIGGDYLIDLLGTYDDFSEIDFDELPQQFVIKANHGSGMNIVVKDKSALNMKYAKDETTRWMNTIFGYEGMEIHYFDIPRKILIEKYIEEMDGNLFDYKIYCFNGEPRYIQVMGNRDMVNKTANEMFFDLDWNKMPFHHTQPEFDFVIERPEKLDELIQVARVLCEGFKYVRVDLYIINNEVKFGEMTFSPANGMGEWNPPEVNYELGKLLDLNG